MELNVDLSETLEETIDWVSLKESKLPLILDFDETFLLRNSSEAYLESAKPAPVAWLICATIDVIRPWRFSKYSNSRFIYRDWIRVLVITLLMPWTAILWKFCIAKRVAQRYKNSLLLDLAFKRDKESVLIATFGFRHVVLPIIKELPGEYKLICPGLFMGYQPRINGKLAMVDKQSGSSYIERSIFFTDSLNDSDILKNCALPYFVKWKSNVPKAAFQSIYLPFLYTEKVKRPGRKYVLRGVIGQDVVALTMACGLFSPNPLSTVISILLLHCALWTVYELGYFENDKMASLEDGGKIPEAFVLYHSRMNVLQAWLWAFAFSIAGAAAYVFALWGVGYKKIWGLSVVNSNITDLSLSILSIASFWICYLVLSRLIFSGYNRSPVKSRVILYPALQLVRLAGYLLLFKSTAVGVALLASFVVGRTYPYVVYRASGVEWGNLNKTLVFTTFIYLGAMFLILDHTFESVILALVAAIWLGLRCRSELPLWKEFLKRKVVEHNKI